jgi:CDP-paratose 2-epimerase
MKLLISGGCGFLGSNIAADAMKRGDSVTLLDNLSRKGTDRNLAWLKTQGDFEFHQADTRDPAKVEAVVRDLKPEALFHLAGQVAMTTSIENPRLDFETNALGTLNVLEALRKHSPGTFLIYSSTNKVYGDLEQFQAVEQGTRYSVASHPHGFDEAVTLSFQSPYGCSKGAADQYILDYARIFGLKTAVFRHSSIFGSRQFSTFDQGWIGWFVERALAVRDKKGETPFTISGNGKQVRDVLFSEDLVACYFGALEHRDACRGQAYNIGGGMANSLSLLELFAWLERELSIKLAYRELPWRVSDQKVFVADIRKAAHDFKWSPRVSKEEGLKRMIAWVGNPESSLGDKA